MAKNSLGNLKCNAVTFVLDIVLFVTCTKLSLAPGVGLAREGVCWARCPWLLLLTLDGNINIVLITWHLRHYAGYTAGQDRSQFLAAKRA